MAEIKELLKRSSLEEGIKRTVEHVKSEEGQVNAMIAPRFFTCNEEKASITLEYDISDWETNSNHVLHGGICATMMDTTIGIFANYLSRGTGNGFAPTVSMSINYLRPVAVGETLCIEAKLNSIGKSLITLYAEAYVKDRSELCATATATFIIQPLQTRWE